jgi:hypothetical protein
MKKLFAAGLVACAGFLSAAFAASPLELVLPKPVKTEARSGFATAEACAKVAAQRAAVPGAPAAVAAEAYTLEVSPDGVKITASDPRGERYARATLAQLLKLGDGKVPCCRIVDWPAMRWRGFMNDCGRNYLEMEGVKAILDVMALYKMNIFHWHLTDYHGWRLESKKYPCLQRPEAFLRQVGRYYTQEEFKEIVAYAAERGITVMPELDVPGHTLSFRLGLDIGTMREPGTERVIDELLRELCSLAPAETMPYIHLGTDEVRVYPEYCDKSWVTRWAKTVNGCGRKAVVWAPGMKIEPGCDVIDMAWYDEYVTNSVNPYIYADYRRTYHGSWTPFDVLSMAAFGDMTRWRGESSRYHGAITSCWHDDNVGEDTLQLFRDCMVFPVIVAMSDNFWSGRKADRPEFRRRLPAPGTGCFAEAEDLENRIAAQRDKMLHGFKFPFPFVRQSAMRWRISDAKTGRVIATDVAQGTVWLDSQGSKEAAFVKKNVKESIALETWIKSPKDQTVGAWIDCAGLFGAYSRLLMPQTPRRGEWSYCGASVSLNGVALSPPEWKQPGMKSTTKAIREQDIPYSTDLLEKPLVDELVTLRPPMPIVLKKGWNHVRIVLPPKKNRRGATFCLVDGTSEHPREVEGLEYRSGPPAL